MPTTFVSKFVANTLENESPLSFWKWAAYGAVSAVLRDNCWIQKQNARIYPNMYTMFVAPSSGWRKNLPIDLSELLVNKVANTKVMSGHASIQAIIEDLGRSETNRNGKMPIKAGSAVFYAPELSAGIVADEQAVALLTNIYDYKSNPFKNMLISRGTSEIKTIVFSMMSATNMSMGKSFLTMEAVRGGLIARTFIIKPNEFRKGFSELDDIPDEAKGDIVTNCYQPLSDISKLTGQFKPENCARDEYRRWYEPFREGYPFRQDPTGILGRIQTGIIKISMVLAANELTLSICKKHVEEAIDVGTRLLPNYNEFGMGVGRSTIAEAAGLLIHELSRSYEYKMSRQTIIMNHWNDIDGEMLDKVVASLEAGGLLRSITENNRTSYQLTEKCIEKMNILERIK
jgi:hypothetical protein